MKGFSLKKIFFFACAALICFAQLAETTEVQKPASDPLNLTWRAATEQEEIIEVNELAEHMAILGCIEASSTEHAQLYNLVTKLAQTAKITMPRVFVVTRKGLFNQIDELCNGGLFDVNAAAISVAKGKANLLLVGEELLKMFSSRELEGVLAHEISHIAYQHSERGVVVRGSAVILSGILAFAIEFAERAGTLGRLKAWFAQGAVGITALLAVLYDSRRCEKQADLRAVKLTKGHELAAALLKIRMATAARRPRMAKLIQFLEQGAPWLLSHPSNHARVAYIKQAPIE